MKRDILLLAAVAAIAATVIWVSGPYQFCDISSVEAFLSSCAR